MKMIKRTGIIMLIVAVALTVGGASAFAKGKKGGATERKLAGEVTALDTTAKSITVERTHLEKKEQKQFTFTDQTVFESIHKKQATPAAATDVQIGSQVRIVYNGADVVKVQILGSHKGGHKGKKK